MRHLTIKQAIRKPPVSHYSRHFHFKDGLNLVAGCDKEMAYPSGDLVIARLFFYHFYMVPEGNVSRQKNKYRKLSIATSDNIISNYSLPRDL